MTTLEERTIYRRRIGAINVARRALGLREIKSIGKGYSARHRRKLFAQAFGPGVTISGDRVLFKTGHDAEMVLRGWIRRGFKVAVDIKDQRSVRLPNDLRRALTEPEALVFYEEE